MSRKQIYHALVFGILMVLALGFSGLVWAQEIFQVPGSQLSGVVGAPVASFRVYRAGANRRPEPVPFQIDEQIPDVRGQGLRWALGEGNGLWEAQEILLVSGRDVGESLSRTDFSQAKAVWEIVLPGQGSATKLYLVQEDAAAPRSSKKYIRYIPETDQVDSDFYRVGFLSKIPWVENFLILKNGTVAENILDRFKARFHLAIKNFFDFNFHEEDVQSRLLGVRVGPLRVIRRVEAKKSLGPIKLVPRSEIDFVFYPSWIEIPTRIQNPVNGPKFLAPDTHGFSGFDFNQKIYGSRLRTSVGEFSLVLDGTPDVLPEFFKEKSPVWWSITGATGSMIIGIQNDPQLNRLGVYPVLKVNDDPGLKAMPESFLGESAVGFNLPYYKIPQGDFLIRVKQVFPKSYTPGSEARYLNEAITQVPTAVRPL